MACVIAAPSSGSGKTILSLLLAAWTRCKGKSLQAFKVGPDYLDSQQLTAVTGRPCRNLDLVLSDPEWVADSFNGFGGSADFALVEGVMGLFDGVGTTDAGSTSSVASYLDLPVVFVVDASGQSSSLAALVRGFRDYNSNLRFAGVVLNNVNTTRHKQLLTEVLAGIGVKTLGTLPTEPQLCLQSRDLGLVPPHEIKDLTNRIESWNFLAKSNLDLATFEELLIAPRPSTDPIKKRIEVYEVSESLPQLPVAVAEDEAFHFIYPETKDFLEGLGMPVIPWNILNNDSLPKEARGVILPGGFPEQYCEQLSNSLTSLSDLQASYGLRPIFAECGGMLLLGQTVTDVNQQTFPMVGLLPFHAKKATLQVGYRTLEGIRNTLVVRNGEHLNGHEFHRWEIARLPVGSSLSSESVGSSEAFSFKSPWRIKGWEFPQRQEGWSNEFLHASWVHLHWASAFRIPLRLRAAMANRLL